MARSVSLSANRTGRAPMPVRLTTKVPNGKSRFNVPRNPAVHTNNAGLSKFANLTSKPPAGKSLYSYGK